ncbi:MAG: RIP metalloprotease RseP [Pseudomonadota bacterium]|nr:RIP metalloprotease RseP [Pseudomonadota bacterium]
MDIIGLLFEKLSFIWEIGVPFLVALTVLVFVHELGHYTVARRCNVRVEVFSIGFGPELCGWNDSHGTRWKISAIPLGGYVKMFGESETISEIKDKEEKERKMTEEEKKVSFHHKTLLQRSSIVVAGPLINFIFAILAFTVLFVFLGIPEPVSDKPLAVVGNVSSGSAADTGGLKSGDQIIAIDQNKIMYFADLQKIIQTRPNKRISVDILRNGKNITLNFIIGSKIAKNKKGKEEKQGLLGISVHPGEIKYIRKNPLEAIWLGFERTYFFTARILEYIWDIFTAEQSADQLGGVLRIAQISGQVAELGIASFISFLAILSINLGLINLFPIPLLDGGHLAFYIIEAIRGRPLGPKAQEFGLKVGLALVGALFLFVTWNDLVYLKFFEAIANILM